MEAMLKRLQAWWFGVLYGEPWPGHPCACAFALVPDEICACPARVVREGSLCGDCAESNDPRDHYMTRIPDGFEDAIR